MTVDETTENAGWRTKALFQLWVLPVGFQVCAWSGGERLLACGFRPDFLTLLHLMLPLAGLLFCAGRWQQVRISFRENGIEPQNEAVAVALRLSLFALVLPDAYRSEHWFVFDSCCMLLVFLLVGRLVRWIGLQREKSISVS